MVNLPEHARWILLEDGTRWVRAIRSLRDAGAARRECARALCAARDETECRAQLRTWPASIVALDVTDESFANRLDLVVAIGREFPLARVIVLWPPGAASDVWTERELVLREAGAAAAARDIWELDRILRFVARRFVQCRAPRADRLSDMENQISNSLPWPGR